MFDNSVRRFAALPLAAKMFLPLVALGVAVFASPLMVLVALLVLSVAVLVLIYRAFRRRPLKNWGLVALASLLLVFVFTGISNALYPNLQSQQASSPSEPKEEAEPTPSESTTERTTAEKTTDPTTRETTTKTSTKVTSALPEPEEDAQGEPEYDATTWVSRVVDGDTIRISPAVNGKDEVRLIGVDTPETKDPDCDVQPYGPEASQFATTELQGEEVELEFDQEREDRYNRLLAYVYKNSDMFNETLLEEGYAQVYIVQPNDNYEDRFEEAQDEAQAAERGIWGLSAAEQSELSDRDNGIGSDECQPKVTPPPPPPASSPAPSPAPTPDIPSTPAASGGSYPPISQNACPANAPIKGNQSGIYHVQGGQFYGRTNPEECFVSEGDAQAAGYRKSQR